MIYFEDDWLLRQINMTVKAIAQLALGEDISIHYDLHREITAGETGNDLRSMLGVLIAQGQYGKAEDLLFETISSRRPEDLKAGLDFFTKLNCLSDQVLEAGNFPRDEIQSGLNALMSFYGISLGETA